MKWDGRVGKESGERRGGYGRAKNTNARKISPNTQFGI